MTRKQGNSLYIGYVNICGQTKLTVEKQLQLEAFVKLNNIDILHCQEIEIDDESFNNCQSLSSSFSIVSNNNPTNRYGTASLVRSDLCVENVRCDIHGRGIIFDIGDISFGNVYIKSGTDNISKIERENYLGETLPDLLINTKSSGIYGRD